MIQIGTRGSQLALTQAEMVRSEIARLLPDQEVRLEVVKTLGDRLSAKEAAGDSSEPAQGLFTKELDEALLSGRIHAAIHSLKDVPTMLPKGIAYGAFVKREDPRDVLVSRSGAKLFELPAGALVGTGSPRREAQIRLARADLKVAVLKGNVDTRLRKLKEGDYDAIVLAAAGLIRLGKGNESTEYLDPKVMLPAPAQGVLCITLRESDQELIHALKPLEDFSTRICAQAERSFLRILEGGCRVPVGALAIRNGEILNLMGVIALPSGEKWLRYNLKGSILEPEKLGIDLGRYFLNHGAQDILTEFGRLPG